MSLRDDITRDTKEAMRSRDRPRIEALRMLSAALKNGEIENGHPLTEDEELAILRRQLKQREESADAFRKAGREEQAQAEETEAEIVRGYLPAPLSDEELRRIIDEAIDETGATSMRDMGPVIGRANALAGNRADGRRLSTLARERLQG
ncbi:MAG: GatB/YqeY domain-containing protein [Actinomycetota bacterium]|nr:GatB/YqeY domain-containing protein [Actinomycetota bacterium]